MTMRVGTFGVGVGRFRSRCELACRFRSRCELACRFRSRCELAWG